MQGIPFMIKKLSQKGQFSGSRPMSRIGTGICSTLRYLDAKSNSAILLARLVVSTLVFVRSSVYSDFKPLLRFISEIAS